jgi:hypothetical protein
LTWSVVDAGLNPTQIVADMETPGPGKIDCAFAEPVDGDDGGRRRGLRLRRAKIESEKQEHEREASEWPANAHLECIVTTLERWGDGRYLGDGGSIPRGSGAWPPANTVRQNFTQ